MRRKAPSFLRSRNIDCIAVYISSVFFFSMNEKEDPRFEKHWAPMRRENWHGMKEISRAYANFFLSSVYAVFPLYRTIPGAKELLK